VSGTIRLARVAVVGEPVAVRCRAIRSAYGTMIAAMARSLPVAQEPELLVMLTSPPMRGEQVRELQLMLRHNPFGTFEPGQVEGIYDEQTAAATRRAKYWLGYPESQIDETADPNLRALLAGEAPLPASWETVRKRRLRRAQETLLWDAALEVAREQLGLREDPPGSRRTPYTRWYGLFCPWSMLFPCFCYAQAGSRAFAPGRRYAYAPYLLEDARRGHSFLSLTIEPLRGDLAVLDADGDGQPERLALFDGWEQEDEPDRFDAIEGDVGYEGAIDGEGAVARTKRGRAEAAAFVHVRA
jgi:hypothetical protein